MKRIQQDHRVRAAGDSDLAVCDLVILCLDPNRAEQAEHVEKIKQAVP